MIARVPAATERRIAELSARHQGLIEYAKQERLTHKGSIVEQIREARLDRAALMTEWGLTP